ncbi:MAG: septum formation initiator family protein [Oscillospiraceae bacterium]|nr:septum formation initiator family protein [Oscillospiraceae bacterium]
MADIHAFLSRFQLQYRRTPTLHKVVVAAAIVLSSVTLISLRLGHWESKAKLSELQHRAAVLEQQNQELREDIGRLGTTDSIRDIAQEELGLVDPDTIIIENAD